MTTDILNNNILTNKPQDNLGGTKSNYTNKSVSQDKDFSNLLDNLKHNLDKTKDTHTTKKQKQEIIPSEEYKNNSVGEKNTSPKKEIASNEVEKEKSVKEKTDPVKKESETEPKTVEEDKTTTSENSAATEKPDKITSEKEKQEPKANLIGQNALNNLLLGSEAEMADSNTTTQGAAMGEAQVAPQPEVSTQIETNELITPTISQITSALSQTTQAETASTQTAKAADSDSDTLETKVSAKLSTASETEEIKAEIPDLIEETSSTENTTQEATTIEIADETLDNLVKVDDTVNTDANKTATLDENQKPVEEKAFDKINQQMLDDMDITVTSVSKQADTSSFSNSGGSKNNAQEDAIKYTIKGLDPLSPSTSQLADNSTQNVFGKTIDNITQLKEPVKADVMNQVNAKLETLKDETVSKVNIILKPESLGRVNIEIINTKDGLSARIIAQTPEAKDILNKNIESLKNTIQSQGVNVNNVSVKVEETQNTAQNSFNFGQESSNKNSSNQEGQNFSNTNSKTAQEFDYNKSLNLDTAEEAEPESILHNGSVNVSV